MQYADRYEMHANRVKKYYILLFVLNADLGARINNDW